MICCSCGKKIDINYGREYWDGIYCKKCADEILFTPEYIKNYEKIIADLKAENAALRKRLEKALELPRIERLFNGKVGSYKVVYQDKNNRITSEYYSEEKREAAEARLAELKGEKK